MQFGGHELNISPPLSGRTLTVYCPWGLCNRLRVLLSGIALAESSDRSFRMFWPQTQHCHAGFHELFENNWNVTTGEPDRATHESMQNLRAFHFQRLPDFLVNPSPLLNLTSNTWLIQPSVHANHSILKNHCRALLEELAPLRTIRDQADGFRNAYFRPRMIGVHIRRGDFLNARHRPHVTSLLRANIAAVDRYLDEAPDAGIILCTDDGAPIPGIASSTPSHGVREAFANRYGNRLAPAYPTGLDRGTTLAIQEALVDLLLLRDATFFVGTTQSSFSEIVALARRGLSTICADPSPTCAYQERFARLTGLYPILMWYARQRLDPAVPFHWVWNVWLPNQLRLLPLRVYWRISGAGPHIN